MAVIIVAVILFLAFMIRYIRYQFKKIREEERNILDIIFLKYFFRVIIKKYKWDVFFNKTHEITIKRKVIIVKTSELNYVYNNGIYLESWTKSELRKSKKKKYCLLYEFSFDDEIISLYTLLPDFYRVFLNFIKNTSFSCEINPNEGKLKIFNSLDEKIFIVSMPSLFESINFAIINRVQLLKEISSEILTIFAEIDEIINFANRIVKNNK